MSTFCISAQKPGPWLRLVITIVIYLVAIRMAPNAATTLALGGTLGSLLAAGLVRQLPDSDSPECAA